MTRRLVLGCGSVVHDLIEVAGERRGELYVVTADPGWVTTLRDSNVPTAEADPADPRNYPASADVVIVAGDDAERNYRATLAARDRFPDSQLIVYAGEGADEGMREEMRSVADQFVDPVTVLSERVLDAAGGTGGERVARLLDQLRALAGPLAVVAHDNPDPDAIASALGLVRIAESVGVQADACYGGDISHQENQALVNLLDIPLRHLEDVDLEGYDGVALVDHSQPGINDSLPSETEVDVVIDHHPPRGPVTGGHVDIRPNLGATSTMIAEYFRRLNAEPDRQLATALLFGIRIDTRNFTRQLSEEDFEAAADLLRRADEETLERVESPSVSPETLRTISRAIRRRDIRNGALASCVGEIVDRDALPQAADRLLTMEGVTVALVYGFRDGIVYASARAQGADIDLGETMREALGQIGSAGGHADMAGAQVPLGILGDVEDETESVTDVVEDIISERFFETLTDAPKAPIHDPEAETRFPED